MRKIFTWLLVIAAALALVLGVTKLMQRQEQIQQSETGEYCTVVFDYGEFTMTVSALKGSRLGRQIPMNPYVGADAEHCAAFVGWYDGDEPVTEDTIVLRDMLAKPRVMEAPMHDYILNPERSGKDVVEGHEWYWYDCSFCGYSHKEVRHRYRRVETFGPDEAPDGTLYKCTVCQTSVYLPAEEEETCPHVLRDLWCMICGKFFTDVFETELGETAHIFHSDADEDSYCDVCGAEFDLGFKGGHEHVDKNENGRCDLCHCPMAGKNGYGGEENGNAFLFEAMSEGVLGGGRTTIACGVADHPSDVIITEDRPSYGGDDACVLFSFDVLQGLAFTHAIEYDRDGTHVSFSFVLETPFEDQLVFTSAVATVFCGTDPEMFTAFNYTISDDGKKLEGSFEVYGAEFWIRGDPKREGITVSIHLGIPEFVSELHGAGITASPGRTHIFGVAVSDYEQYCYEIQVQCPDGREVRNVFWQNKQGENQLPFYSSCDEPDDSGATLYHFYFRLSGYAAIRSDESSILIVESYARGTVQTEHLAVRSAEVGYEHAQDEIRRSYCNVSIRNAAAVVRFLWERGVAPCLCRRGDRGRIRTFERT